MANGNRNFLEVLVDPEKAGNVVDLDIIAVHGLNPVKSTSNALSTWTSKNGTVWLSHPDFLPKRVPNARIMAFGYNSNPDFYSSSAGLNEQADSLLIRLRADRADCTDRPIIFICHSLGGIVVKRALFKAYNNDIDKPTYTATKSIIFFGTPHGGGNKARVGDIAAGIARFVFGREKNSFMNALIDSNFFAKSTREDFLLRAKDFHFVSFIETLPLHGVHQVVKQDAAKLHLPDVHEDKIPMDADHSSICKFQDCDGTDFKIVWQKIEAEAKMVVKKAAINEFLIPYFRDVPHFQGRDSAIQKIKDILFDKQTSEGVTSCTLTGLAGVGKSSVAKHFALTHRQHYHGVFWVSAENEKRLEKDFGSIETEILRKSQQSFRDWCASGTPRRWLLVVDNLDDPPVFDPERREQWIPDSGIGHVIYTSRRLDIESLGQLVKIPPLASTPAADLLLQISEGRQKSPSDQELAESIVETLQYLPLAIQQCGSLISAEKKPLSTYSISFDKLILQIEPPKRPSNIGSFTWKQSARTILTTWEVSFEYLKKYDAEAAELLLCFGFLDRSNISENMLINGFHPQKRFTATGNVDLEWLGTTAPDLVLRIALKYPGRKIREALSNLVTYGLLFEHPHERAYFVHPLIHHWLSVRKPELQNTVLDNTVYLLANGYPHPMFSVHYGCLEQINERVGAYALHFTCVEKFLEDQIHRPRSTLYSAVQLFLHHREMRAQFAKHGGDVLWAADFGSFYDLTEKLVEMLESPAVWLQAMVAYFDLHLLKCIGRGEDFATELPNYRYAGKTWLDVVTKLRDKEDGLILPPTEMMTHETAEVVIEKGGKLEATLHNQPLLREQPEDISLMVPIENHTSSHPEIGLCTAFIGFFALRLIKSWRLNLGKSIQLRDVSMSSSRDGYDLMLKWDLDCPLNSHLRGFIRAMMANLNINYIYKKQRDLRSEFLERHSEEQVTEAMISEVAVLQNELMEQMDLQVDMSVSILQSTIATLGPSTVPGLNIILHHLDAFLEFKNCGMAGEVCDQVLAIPLSPTNVFSKIPLIARWIEAEIIKTDLLEDPDGQSNVKRFLDTWIENLSRCSLEIKQLWTFANDPILDIYEQMIEFLDCTKAEHSIFDHYKQSYANYSHHTYQDRETWLCLGCGLGVFGLKYKRLRFGNQRYSIDPWREIQEEEDTINAPDYTLYVDDMRNLWRKWTDKASQLPTGIAQQQRLAEMIKHHLSLIDPWSTSVSTSTGLLYGRDENTSHISSSGDSVEIVTLRDLLDASALSLDEYSAVIREIPDEELAYSQRRSRGDIVTDAETVENMADEDLECKTM